MKISIVIPSFQDIRILETIQSIKCQNIDKRIVEIIVQDGGSSNSILNEIKKILDDNDRLFCEKDNGIFDAINKGIKNSSNEIILTLGSDDRIHEENVLSSVMALFKKSQYDFVCGSINYTNDKWNPIRFWEATLPSKLNIFFGRQVAHFGFFCKRTVYDEIGHFSKDYPVSADFDFFCRLSNSKLKGGIYKKTSVDMRIGGNSSRNIQNVIKGNIQISKALLKNFNPIFLLHFLFKPFWKLYEFTRPRIK